MRRERHTQEKSGRITRGKSTQEEKVEASMRQATQSCFLARLCQCSSKLSFSLCFEQQRERSSMSHNAQFVAIDQCSKAPELTRLILRHGGVLV